MPLFIYYAQICCESGRKYGVPVRIERISYQPSYLKPVIDYLIWGEKKHNDWFGLVSLFNGISTFVGYFMPKLFSEKNSSGTI